MYISKISLRNIKGFSALDFDLQRPDGGYAGWTVFTGDNGSGKSTLLKAISIGLVGKDMARALQPSFHRWVSEQGGSGESSIELEIVRTDEDDRLVESGKAPGRPFPLKIIVKNGGKETLLQTGVPRGKQKNYSTPERTVWSAGESGWFSCGYGPFRRVFGASPEAARLMATPSTERFVTMFQEAASLAEVDQWLRNLKHKELEGQPAETEQLRLLLRMLADDLMPNQISVDRVDSDGLWLKDRNNVKLSWHEMSDGYRASLALVADILRHLINAHGVDQFREDSQAGTVQVDASGVVLIDEIDAHLHPSWQRQIGFWLKKRFPNIQFLVTTHSPLICQAADPNGIFHLPAPGSEEGPRALSTGEYEKVISSRPDTILLSPAFGLQNTRSPQVVEGRAELSRLESKRRAGVPLTPDEKKRSEQLQLFADAEEE